MFHLTHTLLTASAATAAFCFPKKHEKWGEFTQSADADEKSVCASKEKMKGSEEWGRRRGGEWRSVTVPAAGLINGHLGVQRGMLGRGRECGVSVEVKESSSLSAASDSDETPSFTASWFLPEGNLRPHASHAWPLKTGSTASGLSKQFLKRFKALKNSSA